MNDKPHITKAVDSVMWLWKAEWFGIRGFGQTPSEAYENLIFAPIDLMFHYPRNLSHAPSA